MHQLQLWRAHANLHQHQQSCLSCSYAGVICRVQHIVLTGLRLVCHPVPWVLGHEFFIKQTYHSSSSALAVFIYRFFVVELRFFPVDTVANFVCSVLSQFLHHVSTTRFARILLECFLHLIKLAAFLFLLYAIHDFRPCFCVCLGCNVSTPLPYTEHMCWG